MSTPPAWIHVLIALSVLGTGCRQDAGVAVRVGEHHLLLQVPDGWRRIDYGRRQVFERDLSRLVLEDLGPVSPPGYIRELAELRALWTSGQKAVVSSRLADLHLIEVGFASHEDYAAGLGALGHVGDMLRTGSAGQVDAALRSAIVVLRSLPAPSPETFVDYALAFADHDQRREIATQRSCTVDGRAAMAFTTRDRLSHTGPKPFFLAVNDGSLLLATTGMGRPEDLQAPFDALVGSIHFAGETPGRDMARSE